MKKQLALMQSLPTFLRGIATTRIAAISALSVLIVVAAFLTFRPHKTTIALTEATRKQISAARPATDNKTASVSDQPAASADSTAAAAKPATTQPSITSSTKQAAPASKAAPTSPAGAGYKYGVAPIPANALKYIVSAQEARSSDGLRYYFDFQLVRDGSYTGAAGATGGYLSGPGKPGDVYCGASMSSASAGLGEIIVNPTAPDGTYRCRVGEDIGYTRFSTYYSFTVSGDSVTILPGAEIVPGTQI